MPLLVLASLSGSLLSATGELPTGLLAEHGALMVAGGRAGQSVLLSGSISSIGLHGVQVAKPLRAGRIIAGHVSLQTFAVCLLATRAEVNIGRLGLLQPRPWAPMLDRHLRVGGVSSGFARPA